MSAITIQQADVSHASLLARVSLQSFSEAFEQVNNPDDFKTYVNAAFSERQIIRDLEEPGSIFYLRTLREKLPGMPACASQRK